MNKRQVLESAIGAVSRETFERLIEFERLFLDWNKSINLIAPSTVPQFWSRHVIDSAQIVQRAPSFETWMDLGSGGGLPGLVVAILVKEAANGPIAMVESNHKKAAFLKRCSAELGLNTVVLTQRIQDIDVPGPDVISARALASLTGLFALTEHWFSPQTRAILHKGQDFQREVREARDLWDFHLIEHISVVDPMSRVLEISNVKRLER